MGTTARASLVMIFMLAACATPPPPQAYLSGKVDPYYKFSKSQPIYVALLKSSSIEEKQFHHALVTEMTRAGFTVTDKVTDDTLFLFFSLTADTTFVDQLIVLPDATTTMGSIGTEPFGSSSFSATSLGTQVVPYRMPYTVEGIHLYLYRAKNRREPDMVWQGYLGTQVQELSYDAHDAVRHLLKIMGQNYEGPVILKRRNGLASNDLPEAGPTGQASTPPEPIQTTEVQDKELRDLSSIPRNSERAVQDVSQLTMDCDREMFSSCVELAARYQGGIGVSKNPVAAARLYEKGCRGHDAEACMGLGMLYAEGYGVTRDGNRARTLLAKGCDGGVPQACFTLGAWFKSGKHGNKDEIRALKLFQQACDGGDGMGCFFLALEYFIGEVVSKDYKQGLALLEQGCQNQEPAACGRAADVYGRGLLFVQRNRAKALSFNQKALPLYKRACEEGREASCGVVGAYYEKGDIVPQDSSQALRYYQQACTGGSLSGCVRLGNFYLDETQGQKDPGQAAQAYSGACDTKDLAFWERGLEDRWKGICYSKLATLYESGEGVPKDQARAAALFQKACDIGWDTTACTRVGSLKLEEESMGTTRKGDALPALRKGCYAKLPGSEKVFLDDEGCQQLAAVLADLCKGGEIAACGELSDIAWKENLPEKYKPLISSAEERLCTEGSLNHCYRLTNQQMVEAYVRLKEQYELAETRFSGTRYFVPRSQHDKGDVPPPSSVSIGYTMACADGKYLTGDTAPCNQQKLFDEAVSHLTATEDRFLKYCQAGHWDSCKQVDLLAFQYEQGLARFQDHARADVLTKGACDGAIAMACRRLAEHYAENPTKERLTLASERFRQACNLKDAYSCGMLGSFYKDGLGVEKDVTKANDLYLRSVGLWEKDCESSKDPKASLADRDKAFTACWQLAELYLYSGGGVPKDETKGVALMKQACGEGRGHEKACEKAFVLHTQDCERGRAADCTALGTLYQSGHIIPKDMQRAKKAYQQACSGKDGKACYELGDIYRHGWSGTKKPSEAKALYQQACTYGFGLGCLKDSQ